MWLNFRNNVDPKKQIIHIKFKNRQKQKYYFLIHSHYGYRYTHSHTHIIIKSKNVINAKFRTVVMRGGEWGRIRGLIGA